MIQLTECNLVLKIYDQKVAISLHKFYYTQYFCDNFIGPFVLLYQSLDGDPTAHTPVLVHPAIWVIDVH